MSLAYCKTWTGFVKHGLLLPIHTLKIIPVYFLFATFCTLFHMFTGCAVFTFSELMEKAWSRYEQLL